MFVLVGGAVVGLVLLTAAADQLVVGAGRLAAGWGISPVVVGVVVIGVGTSAPEFVVSGLAAAGGNSGLAVGNLVGSNIVNVTLILGVAALVGPIAVRSSVSRREAPLTVGAVIVLAVLAMLGLGRIAGIVLLALTVAAVGLLIRTARGPIADPLAGEVDDFLDRPPIRRPGREVLRAVAGLAGTLAGAQLLVVTAMTAADRLGVPASVVGLTVVALGTSLPELVTAIQAQRRGEGDLLIGNLLGSNLFNSLAGGAVVGLAGRGSPASLGYAAPAVMVVVNVVVWLLLRRQHRIGRVGAGLLLTAYVVTFPLVT
ncbi:calcium/sodium antiporter [Paractinoplanes globisporus]|uniref:Calcium/sodium antiporter n=1 Tax=Paractinoplanes globisporus TaxID=113565 RepID=A0ABW6W8V3_9ACTN|nr:calcium/sodium antiporter [Actinoplanes globisporus]